MLAHLFTGFAAAMLAVNISVVPPAVTVTGGAEGGGGLKEQGTVPTAFEGDHTYYHAFQWEMLVYFKLNNALYVTDVKKVLAALMWMKGDGDASRWAVRYQDAHMVQGALTIMQTFDIFLKELDASFDDPSKKTNALQELKSLQQGSMTADAFFQHFDILQTDAGLMNASNNVVLIDML